MLPKAIRKFKITSPVKQAIEIRKTFTTGDMNTLKQYVRTIIENVKTQGDKALIELTQRYDGVLLSLDELMVSRNEIEEAYSEVNESQIEALSLVKANLETVEKTLFERLIFTVRLGEDIEIRNEIRPIENIGCYIPRGKAGYPSTSLMTVVPAKVAGVKRIVVCSPPLANKKLSPLFLVAADALGVNEIYKVGGAQAIAALAYGTETIKPVDKIVGPGNIYVSIAKQLVSEKVGIDNFAGPTELLILADDSAKPHFVALDLISQIEHDPMSITGLLTNSIDLAEAVEKETIRLFPQLGKLREEIEKRLMKNCFIGIANIDLCLDFVNAFGPEHLEIISKEADEIARRVINAGLILIGNYTPASLSDYCLGTNHVLPTGGYSRYQSRLSVLDFVKLIQITKSSKKTIENIGKFAATLAESEKFLAHTMSLLRRIT